MPLPIGPQASRGGSSTLGGRPALSSARAVRGEPRFRQPRQGCTLCVAPVGAAGALTRPLAWTSLPPDEAGAGRNVVEGAASWRHAQAARILRARDAGLVCPRESMRRSAGGARPIVCACSALGSGRSTAASALGVAAAACRERSLRPHCRHALVPLLHLPARRLCAPSPAAPTVAPRGPPLQQTPATSPTLPPPAASHFPALTYLRVCRK